LFYSNIKLKKKNEFDYFIKIRNFENEEVQFLYANTKFWKWILIFFIQTQNFKNERI